MVLDSRRLIVAAIIASACMALALMFGARGGLDSPPGTASPAGPANGNAHAAPTGGPVSSSWAFRPESLSQLTRRADAVVEAKVVEVRRGPDLSPENPGNGGAVGIPTQRIELDVLETIRAGGAATAVGERLTLFRTGGVSQTNGGAPLALEGDPPYRASERYVLFLTERHDGLFIPTAPDGRLRKDASGGLEPLIDGPVGERLRGKGTADVRRIVASAGVSR